jgi:hypothetical protein
MKTTLKIIGSIFGVLFSISLFVGLVWLTDKLMDILSDNFGSETPWVLLAVFLLGGIGYGGALAGNTIINDCIKRFRK